MNKKFIILTLFTLLCVLPTIKTFDNAFEYYKNIIKEEYQKNLHGDSPYFQFLPNLKMNMVTDLWAQGKTASEKKEIIKHLQILKNAIDVALEIAKSDGQGIWYWLYLIQDNEIIIYTLNQYRNQVNHKLNEFIWESNSEMIKQSWYLSKYVTTFFAGMIATWALQGNFYKLNQNSTIKN